MKGLNEKQILLLLIGIAFALRLYAVVMARGIAYDSASYGFMARDFLKGEFVKGISTAFHPFYPFLISLVSFDSTNVEIAGRLISLFFGTLTLIPVFYLMKEVMGQKMAIFSDLFYFKIILKDISNFDEICIGLLSGRRKDILLAFVRGVVEEAI